MKSSAAIFIFTLFFTSMYSHAAVKSEKITAAIDCTQASQENNYQGTCPYLSEVLKGDPNFRKIFLGTLSKYKIERLNGPEFPFETILINGEKYITGGECEAHNCGPHQYIFIYSLSKKTVSGIYKLDESSNQDEATPYLFGDPNEAEKNELIKLLKMTE